jgi:hypothetical protein
MSKFMRCPICYAELISGKGIKMHCPTEGCDFVERRDGNSVLDPGLERRGRKIQYYNKFDDPFCKIRWKK